MKIETFNNKAEIRDILEKFSPYLYTLSSGKVDKDILAQKLHKYARVIGVKEDNKIIGFAGFYCNDSKNRNAYLSLIAVDPYWRKQGVGKVLLNEVKLQASNMGMNQLVLEVRKENIKAIKFYQKSGFEKMGKESRESFFLKIGLK